MKNALLFRDNADPILVSADDVKDGKYDRYAEYVDPEYEFKVEYVKGAKHGGGPYFRLYYSYEDYKRLYPERADRYQIVANMRKYEESEWHQTWKANVSGFCCIEKTIHNKELRRWKVADAYYADAKTCIEFQHSYISFHFEEKNEFYRALSLQSVWLYDLSRSNINLRDDGSIDILEDNAKGFFRISENADNLRDNFVYIQVKSGKIYRVTELERRETSQKLKSTIRYFWPSEVFDEKEFVATIQNNSLKKYADILSEREMAEQQKQKQEAERLQKEQEAERLRKEREAEWLRQTQEAERRWKEQEAERLRQKQEAEKCRKEQEDERRRQEREAARLLRQQNIDAMRKQKAAAKQQREDPDRQGRTIEEIQYADYEQTEHYVIDRNGERWIQCKYCKRAVKFGSKDMHCYDESNPNRGTCYNCRFKW